MHARGETASESAGAARPQSSIGVIGAGISGLCAARVLADRGLRVCVFGKARGVGGQTCISIMGRSTSRFTTSASGGAVCGDWCQSARIEGAFLSGLAAAERLIDRDVSRKRLRSHER